MTTQTENKATVKAFVEELVNQHNPSAWETYCAEDFRHHFNLPDVPADRAGIRTVSEGVLKAFPDVKVQIDLLLAEGDFVVERASAGGTHTGEFNGIAPTGKHFTWLETHVYRLRDGQIVEHWPEVRLEKLLYQVQGRDGWFTGPNKSWQSKLIAVAMGRMSQLYRGDTGKDQVERNRSIVQRYIEEFKNQQKFLVFPRLFARGFSHHFDFPELPNSMETFVSVGQNFLSAFPDVKADVQLLLADGQYVVERNAVHATHRGYFNGVEPTGRSIEWTEIHIYRLGNGKIVENWPQVNFERILMQIL